MGFGCTDECVCVSACVCVCVFVCVAKMRACPHRKAPIGVERALSCLTVQLMRNLTFRPGVVLLVCLFANRVCGLMRCSGCHTIRSARAKQQRSYRLVPAQVCVCVCVFALCALPSNRALCARICLSVSVSVCVHSSAYACVYVCISLSLTAPPSVCVCNLRLPFYSDPFPRGCCTLTV